MYFTAKNRKNRACIRTPCLPGAPEDPSYSRHHYYRFLQFVLFDRNQLLLFLKLFRFFLRYLKMQCAVLE